jgi:hypothetical protein
MAIDDFDARDFLAHVADLVAELMTRGQRRGNS